MRGRIVGFDRRIEREWLEFAAAQAAGGLPAVEMRRRLWNFLDGRVSAGSSGWNSDRGKVITVLMRIWGPGSGRYAQLRTRAVDAIDGVSAESRLPVHWALCLSSYPFFADVARITGQHLALHSEVQLVEVRRRLIETWGDRAVVRLAAQRILRSMIDWTFLRDGGHRGVYLQGSRQAISGQPACRLLVEGLLLSQAGDPLAVSKLASHPSFFPFPVEVSDLTLGRDDGVIRLEREALGSGYLRLAQP